MSSGDTLTPRILGFDLPDITGLAESPSSIVGISREAPKRQSASISKFLFVSRIDLRGFLGALDRDSGGLGMITE